MFRSIRLGSVYGIPLTVHWSLLLLAAWFVSLAWVKEGPAEAAEAAIVIAGAIASVTLHEFGHVLAARQFGIGTRSINLSPIGGIAFLERYPDRPGQRAVVALSGPVVSMALAIVFGIWSVTNYASGKELGSPVDILFLVNVMLLAFNLLPIYPMDGGQALDAVVTKVFGKAAARRVSCWTGHVGAVAMFVTGICFPSVSLVLIGAFLLVAVSLEFGNPVTRSLGLKPRSPREDEKACHNGVFVAYDGEGRHFAYARHWLDCPEDMEAQKREVVAYAYEAYRRGGELRLLTLKEFREQVLASVAR